jgi:hypothetical protein
MTAWPAVTAPGSPEALALVQRLETVDAPPLEDVEAFLSRFVAFPSEAARIAVTLWAVHCHVVDCFDSTPRLAVLSPEPGSGKSRVLEVLELLVPRAVHAVNATPAYLFRKVSDEAGLPTILYDEVDTIFGPKAKDNEDVRGMLNAGHRRGATAGRAVVRGKQVFTEELPAFCPVALAGLGDLPDTLMTRSIVIRMRRRAPHETVEPFRHRVHRVQAEPLRLRLEEWADEVRDDLADVWPEMPAEIQDRAADVWEALFAVADTAGGEWPEKARVAAVTLVTLARTSPGTLGLQLLADVRTVFDQLAADIMLTSDLLEHLVRLDESPWADLRGKQLDPRGLGKRLRAYEVESRTVRLGERVAKGYRREDLHDAWLRYLPNALPSISEGNEGHTTAPRAGVTSVTTATEVEVAEPDAPLWAEP